MFKLHFQRLLVFLLLLCCSVVDSGADVVNYELTLSEQRVNITGQPVTGMTVNGSIPGPTLYFTEGDQARIVVHNQLSEPSSIHWHGLLVPPTMDGVPLVSFPPIAPGSSFVYEFPIRHSGTYWYHSHSGLQEQRGVYGALVIQPRQPLYQVDREQVLVLSDWTDEDPHQVLRTLKRGSERYALEKGAAQSLVGAVKAGRGESLLRRELQRMPAMDVADVAYDRFLINGAETAEIAGQPGELVRLRLVNGSATSYFYVEFAAGPLKVVAADGQLVEPFVEPRLLMAVAETYDVLVRLPRHGRWELRATAHDGSAHASLWLGQGERHAAAAVPRPNLYAGMDHFSWRTMLALTPAGAMGMPEDAVAAGHFDRPCLFADHCPHQPGGSHGHDSHPAAHAAHATGHAGHGSKSIMDSAGVDGRRFGRDHSLLGADAVSRPQQAAEGSVARPTTPYTKLRALTASALDDTAPLREIRLTLDGDMERYLWSLGGQPLSAADDLLIHQGERVRLILINRTMMHHPMHLHGHFFRVLNGQGDHAPLKHTVDVAPMSTTVIEFAANEVGDWFFHCHLLYHMKSGMARLLHYADYPLPPQLATLRPQFYRESWLGWGAMSLLSHRAAAEMTWAAGRTLLHGEGELGWGQVDGAEWEGQLMAERVVNRFFSVMGGYHADKEFSRHRAFVGLGYLLPLNFHSQGYVAHDGALHLSVAKELALLPRLHLDAQLHYDSDERWGGRLGLSYALQQQLDVRLEWDSDYRWGFGVQAHF